MQGTQLRVLLADAHHLVVDDHGGMEILSAVQHAVTDGSDLTYGGNGARLFVHEGFEHELDGFLVGGHILVYAEGSAVRRLLGEGPALHTYAVAETFQEHGLVRDVDELIFEGGTPRIDDEYVHIPLTSRIAAR